MGTTPARKNVERPKGAQACTKGDAASRTNTMGKNVGCLKGTRAHEGRREVSRRDAPRGKVGCPMGTLARNKRGEGGQRETGRAGRRGAPQESWILVSRHPVAASDITTPGGASTSRKRGGPTGQKPSLPASPDKKGEGREERETREQVPNGT